MPPKATTNNRAAHLGVQQPLDQVVRWSALIVHRVEVGGAQLLRLLLGVGDGHPEPPIAVLGGRFGHVAPRKLEKRKLCVTLLWPQLHKVRNETRQKMVGVCAFVKCEQIT